MAKDKAAKTVQEQNLMEAAVKEDVAPDLESRLGALRTAYANASQVIAVFRAMDLRAYNAQRDQLLAAIDNLVKV